MCYVKEEKKIFFDVPGKHKDNRKTSEIESTVFEVKDGKKFW